MAVPQAVAQISPVLKMVKGANRRHGGRKQEAVDQPMGSTVIMINLFGAIALLLFGLSQVKDGVTRAFGIKLRTGLARGTKGSVRSFFGGIRRDGRSSEFDRDRTDDHLLRRKGTGAGADGADRASRRQCRHGGHRLDRVARRRVAVAATDPRGCDPASQRPLQCPAGRRRGAGRHRPDAAVAAPARFRHGTDAGIRPHCALLSVCSAALCRSR